MVLTTWEKHIQGNCAGAASHTNRRDRSFRKMDRSLITTSYLHQDHQFKKPTADVYRELKSS